MTLLSTGGWLSSSVAAHVGHARTDRPVRHHTKVPISYTSDASSDPTSITTPGQTVSLAPTLTNFTNAPLTPNVNLFNPSLGTLLSVAVSHTALIQSNIVSQNLSPSSPTVITATVSGSYEIDGLNQPISQPTKTISSAPMPAGVFGSGTDTVTFPTLSISDSGSGTFTDPSSLAFFTSSAGRSSITLTMNATATASASAPNGNLLTTTMSSAQSTVTVTYTYMSVCPTVSGIGRIGVHHQQTQLVVTFDGPVDTTKVDNPANYTVLAASGKKIAIKSATFDPATNAVTLVPERRLNVHYHFKLSVVIPCANEQTPETVIIPFGGKESLIGFHNHRGEFVTVKDGRVTGYYDHSGQYVPVHRHKVQEFKH
jgi:hypothetical protein